MNPILPSSFFNRPTLLVARELLDKLLVRQQGKTITTLLINEVEAYDGPEDKACHASKGKTERNAAMFGPPGYFYVYLIYGVYWMLNIVTGPKDYPAAILIRGADTYDGPGKLTKQLCLDKSFNGKKADKKTGLWFEENRTTNSTLTVVQTPRIGVNYAGPIWSTKPYRFVLKTPLSVRNPKNSPTLL